MSKNIDISGLHKYYKSLEKKKKKKDKPIKGVKVSHGEGDIVIPGLDE